MAHLTLFQFNQLLKEQLQQNISPRQWVIAEIGELKINQKGHCYMELVEKEGNFIQAKIRANIWAYQFKGISSAFQNTTGSALAPGQKVLLNVSVNFHEVYGLSLNVNDIDPNFTLGERSRQREITLKKLTESGALNKNKSLTLPIAPQQIAIISSETAAGYQDFEEQMNSNPRGLDFNLSLFNALMQGDQAPQSIIEALDRIEEQGSFDLIVMIRGGGAQTDLDCFDNEALCIRISTLKTPLITGIGHQRDQTLSDLVAHTSLKTPTAVAEFIIDGIYRYDDYLHEATIRLKRIFEQQLQIKVNELERFELRLNGELNHQLSKTEESLNLLSAKLKNRSENRLLALKSELTNYHHQIRLNDPMTIMKKGYTMTLKEGKSIHHQELNEGDELMTIGEKVSVKSIVKK